MKQCFDCKHRGWDPDGEYCVHPEVLKTNPWGSVTSVPRGVSYIRDNPDDDRNKKPHFNICGEEAKLFELRKAD